MATLLILITPCIALTAPLLSPAISIFAVLVLVVILSILVTVLFVQTWIMAKHNENEAVVGDATKFVHAAFASRARDPGVSSTCFGKENGVVVHRHSASPNCGYGFADGTGLEEVGLGGVGSMWTDGGELGSWSEFIFAWGRNSSSVSSRKGHAALRIFGGFWVAIRRLEGSERMSHMV